MLLLVLGAFAALLAAGPVFGLSGYPLVLFELTAIGAMFAANRWYRPQIDRWLRGAEGERRVGAALAELTADGWMALHGVSLGRGDVDHILIGPGGIFTIETKSHRGRIPIDRIDPRMLKQAYAEKKLIERITGMEVQSLLVFSRAWLIGSVPAQRNGVTILPARMLGHYFSRRRPVLTAERAGQIHGHLAQALGTPEV
ncbi:MAG TPA: nuclease-related domain-containing protein [Solirubrobacterales bacterium]|nr:nuclease-related domain-containing protein [Solirubrobacterales bacterium]